MASSSSSFQNAINPPDIDGPHLQRPRLLELIDRHRQRRLLLVHAPAGYGKTTLLADYGRSSDIATCWLRLSAADRDVMRMATVLEASLAHRFHRLRGQIDLKPLAGTAIKGLARIFADAIREEINEPFLLIFDDVQWVNPSQQTCSFLDLLLQELPSNVTFVLAGRELPRVSLARLVVDAEVGGLGPQELALTLEEAGDLVEEHFGFRLPPPQLERLYRETEGWMTGVLLSAPQGTGAAVSRAHHDLQRVMASFVLEGQPQSVAEFLLASAVLPVMTSDACDAVLDRDDSATVLEQLLRGGLFITALHTRPKSYEYHPLLRDALIETLERRSRQRLRDLRQKAASYYAQRGDEERAVDLYLSGGDLVQAAQLAETSARPLFEAGRLATLEEWADRLRAGGAACPRLFHTVATGAFDRGEVETASDWCAAGRRALDSGQRDQSLQIRFDILEGRIAIREGEPARALELAKSSSQQLAGIDGELTLRGLALRLEALALYHLRQELARASELAGEAFELLKRAGEDYTAAQVLLDLSLIHSAIGRFPEAQQACQRAHALLQRIGSPLPLAIATNNLAVLAHQYGRYDRAIDLFDDALQLIRRVGSDRLEAFVLLGQGDLFNDLGLAHQAGDFYGEGLRLAARIQNQQLMRYGYTRTAALHRHSGNLAGAADWLDRAKRMEDKSSDAVAIGIQSSALDLHESPQAALQDLSKLQGLPDRQQESAEEATLLRFFLAAACQIAGEQQAAREHLASAFGFASQHGTLQSLAGELMHDRSMLEFAQRELADHPVIQLLVHRIEFMELVASRYGRVNGAGEPAELSLTALGEVEIQVSGTRFTDLSPLPRQLLFFLADHDPAQRDLLLETFWPGVPVKKQSSSLYTAVHTLRDKLGEDLITIEGSLYSLSSEANIHYDVLEFERTRKIARSIPKGDARRALALTQAVEAYGGPFLPEYHSDWVLDRRRALEADYLELLLDHSEAAAAKGQRRAATGSLEQALAVEPMREDINLRYLQLLRQQGRISEAVRHYHSLVHQLSDELGVDPSAELRRLYEELIR